MNEKTNDLLDDISEKRKNNDELNSSKQAIIQELIAAQHKKDFK